MTAVSSGTITYTTFTSHDLVVVQTQIFGVFKLFLNGTITNDKFCMSRAGRLRLSWWRLPLRAREAVIQAVEYPSEGTNTERCPQEDTHEETAVDRSASHD